MDNLLDDLGFLLAERLPVLRKGTPDAKRTLEAARLLRQFGCGLLLSRLDTSGFRHHLLQAASIYLELLEHRPTHPGLDPYYLARSKGEPLFDALAAGALELARKIASLMPPTWMERMEPEEDFHYFGALLCLVLERDASGALAAFERCLQGGTSHRFDTVRALAAKDTAGFDRGLRELCAEEAAWRERQRRSGLFDPHLHQTEAFVFVEGVALVRLARWLGMETPPGYPLIPEPALDAA
ncbi:Imm49 family immunity protein [Archangium sp.]|uniref:Imm49 family immunity protein n=1 Tax=Archangium sp. TaxID=1872627 RepID=UPI002D448AE5|nr:Imm49 family immunity protein [Archangium sp.]HYO59977.1 Imm49 family immunity protein [Archangium sp.]